MNVTQHEQITRNKSFKLNIIKNYFIDLHWKARENRIINNLRELLRVRSDSRNKSFKIQVEKEKTMAE